jgi:hypothetical protein
MAVQRFPVQEGIDLINDTGGVKSSIVFQAGIPDTPFADSMVSPTWWFDTTGGGVYWKKLPGSGFDKWARVAEDDVKQAEELDFVITGAGPSEITTLYIGRAEPGALLGDPVWSISRSIIESGLDNDTSQKWADGDSNFDNIWDDRKTTIVYLP